MGLGHRAFGSFLAGLLLTVSLNGCGREPAGSEPAPYAQRAAGEIVQDEREDGALLFSTVQPVPPHSDAARTLLVRLAERDARANSKWTFDGTPLLDARFVPVSLGLVAITEQRELVLLPSSGASPVVLDTQVHAPLSLSRNGRYVAYARGEAPDLEIARLDLRTRRKVSETQGMAPTWSPCLSGDGEQLFFVSGSTGRPEIWESRSGRDPVRLTDRQRESLPFPSGPTSPIWSNGMMAFEGSDGVHVIAVDPLRLVRSVAGTLPVAASDEGSFIVHDSSGSSARRERFLQPGGSR